MLVTANQHIFEEIAIKGVVHLHRFIPASEIRDLRNRFEKFNLLDEFNTIDDDGRVQEVTWLNRSDPALLETQTFRRCFEFANEMYGGHSHLGFDQAIIKSPGSGPGHWHQDQFYSKFDNDKQCISFWIPLQPVNSGNGGMEYAVGSQKRLLAHNRVSAKSDSYHVTDLPPIQSFSPSMELGDVCVHTPMTLHRSHPNPGTSDRLAWILQFNRYGTQRVFRWRNLRQSIARLTLS